MSHATLTDRILATVQRSGNATFLRLLSAEGLEMDLSYVGLLQQATLWARIYKDRGLKPRQRVIILVSHSIDTYASFLGAIVSGLVPAILPPPSPKLSKERFGESVASLIPTTHPDAIVIGAEFQNLSFPTMGAKVISTLEALNTPQPEHLSMEASGRGDATAFLQYSSGTTGLRKGVAISHAACLQQVDIYGAAIELSEADSIVSWLPLYHDMGLIACWLLPLLTGTPVTAMSPFDWIARPALLTQAIRTYRSTLCWLPNFAFFHLARNIPDSEMANDTLTSMRAFINCSEPISESAHSIFLRKFAKAGAHSGQIATCYAMAEATFAVTSSRIGAPPVQIHVDAGKLSIGSLVQPGTKPLVSAGRPISGVNVRIADDRGGGVPESVVGNVYIRSPMLTTGYFNNATATRAALTKGEFRTGDVGFLSNNELFVLGRADDTIIVAGKNLFPQDLEMVVNSIPDAIPGRSVAFGVGEERDGTSYVVVIAETDRTGDRSDLEGRIAAELVSRMDVSPKIVRAVDRGWLRKSTSGKISRGLCRQRYLSELAPSLAAPTKPLPIANLSLIEFVRAAVTNALGRECPADDEPLITSGRLDSFALAALLVELGERFGDRVPMPNVTGFHHFNSISAIYRLLSEVEHGVTIQSRQATYSAREVKLKAFVRASTPIDLAIYGSSTAFAIPCRPAEAMGLSAFNLSVNFAAVADSYCLMRYSQEARGVRRIIACLDIFAFKPRNGSVFDTRMMIFPELTKYLTMEDQAAVTDRSESIALDSKRRRVNLHRLLEWRPKIRYSFSASNGDLTLGDLSVSNRPGGFQVEEIEAAKSELTMIYGDYTEICPKQCAYLEEFIRATGVSGTPVDFVVMPIHSGFEAFLTEATNYPARRRDILSKLDMFSNYTIRVHDFPTTKAFGGDDADFEDACHIGASNGERLLRRILSA